MTTSQHTLTLLSGSEICLQTVHAALLPEVVSFEPGAFITLENDKREFLGTAEVTDVMVETFALLQNKHLEQTTHNGTTSWPNALATLAAQVPGFSQLDKVSVVSFYVNAVAGSGLTIAAAEEQAPAEIAVETPVPTEEEQYAALYTLMEVDGNHV